MVEGASFSVDDFGAVGDGVTDDTAAIQAAFDAADAAGGAMVRFDSATQYLTSDTVTLQDGNSLDMNGAEILYSGPRDRAALVIGAVANANNYADLRKLAVRSSAIDWTSANFVGIRLINLQRSTITISLASSFNVGIDLYAEDNYCAYNQIFVDAMSACKYSQRLITIGSGSTTFVNENTFYGGSFLQTSATDGLGDAYGILITWDKSTSYRRQNNNVWYRPAFELRYGNAGGSVRDCVLFDGAGDSCRFLECRRENSGRAMNVVSDNFAYGRDNTFTSSFDESNQSGAPVVVSDRGTGNVFKGSKPETSTPATWVSGDLTTYFSSGGAANSFHAAEPFHVASSADGVPVSEFTSSNLDLDLDAVRVPTFASTFGFFLDTETTKSFVLQTTQKNDANCRIVIRCFDADGALLNDSGLTNWYVSGAVIGWTTNFGGGYRATADTFSAASLRFKDDVKSAQIFLCGGTNPALLQGLSVTALNGSQPPRIYSGLARQPNTRRATAKPDTAGTLGSYAQGDFIANASAAAAATPGWTATNTGRLARAWAISTAYSVGQLREKGGNIYVVKTAGTSAGSGGPTGTGTGITDNTVVWDYVCPKSTFATHANLV